MTRQEWIYAAQVALAFALVFALAEIWARKYKPPVEWTRKFAHVGGGLVASVFPWLFQSLGMVALLSASFAGVLAVSRKLGLLKSVHGVSRATSGAVLFPVAVVLLFWLSADRPVLYLASMLTLVVSDALAAVFGKSYGSKRFAVEGEFKSLEGSAVFFLSTFLVVHLPLVMMTKLDPRVTVLAALQIAILVTSFEAIALEGFDNLIVPLGTLYLLDKLVEANVSWMVLQLSLQGVVILSVAWLTLRYGLFSFAGAVGAQLYFYGAASLGNPWWVVAPAMAVAAMAFRLHRRVEQPRYQVRVVFYVTIVSAVVYFLGNYWRSRYGGSQDTPLFSVFCGLVAGQLGNWALARPIWRFAGRSVVLWLGAWAWVVPMSFFARGRPPALAELEISVLTAAVTMIPFVLLQRRQETGTLGLARRQFLAALVGASLSVTYWWWKV